MKSRQSHSPVVAAAKAQEGLTRRCEELCAHYGRTPTRNNPGVAHENESAHGHLKKLFDDDRTSPIWARLASRLRAQTADRIESDTRWRWKLEKGANLLLFGPPGAGKSHLAAAIGLALVENGWRVLFTRTSELVQRLQIARRELGLESAIAKLDKYLPPHP